MKQKKKKNSKNKQPKKSQTCNMQWRQRKTIPVVLRHFTGEEFFAIWCLLWCSEAWSNTRGRWNWRMSCEEAPHHRKHSQVEDSCCYELLKTSAGCLFSFKLSEAWDGISFYLPLPAVCPPPSKKVCYVRYLSSWHALNHKGSAACCPLLCPQLKISWGWAS